MHMHIGYVWSKEDVDGIHIAPARHKRSEGGGTYLCYKIGGAFILHYPRKVRRKREEVWRWFILDNILQGVTGCTPTRQGSFHRYTAWLLHIFRTRMRAEQAWLHLVTVSDTLTAFSLREPPSQSAYGNRRRRPSLGESGTRS